ncbi:acyltransferase [Synechococcus sp. AH-558-M21]|nr:acyltransferase [Synechococcus sp. AH-558-M21]
MDGLRAFAVVAVIINHFNKDILPGGYLGVDIFFVISGYVITSSLFERPSKDFKDFISGFYERRIKRLVPTLSVFVLISCLLTAFFITPHVGTLNIANLRTGISSLFGMSNLYLYKQATDYFGASSELNVFTHTWSLGVEEQFYILFPFLIWFSGFGRQTKNGARNLFLIVGALTIASLVGFLYLYPTNQPAAYFLMPSRFWEMAAGCLIFIGFQKRASVEQLLEKVPPLLLMALIVGVMYLPISLAATSTIAVVALSSILIASLKKQTAAFNIFTHPRVVYIGLISYSLYLWHWGVLSISRWTIGIHWWSVPFQVALMLGLAIASYRWIETPLRKGNWFGKRWKTLVVGGGILVIISGSLVALGKPLKGKLYLGRLPNLHNASEMPCEPEYRILFVGDSHASQYEQAKYSFCQKVSVESLSVGGTPYPIVNYTNNTSGRTKTRNAVSNIRMMKLINTAKLPESKKGVVVVSIRAPLYFYDLTGSYKFDIPGHFDDANNTFLSQQQAQKEWLESLGQWIGDNHLVNFILLSPTPDFEMLYPQEVCSGEWFQNNNGKKHCSSTISTSEARMRHGEFSIGLQRISSMHSNAYFFDGFSAICPQESLNTAECSTHDGSVRLYMDDNHLNIYGAEKVISLLLKFIESKDQL